jgi:hypothetical protein
MFVFVEKRLKLIFLFIEFFDSEVPNTHLFLLFFHLGELVTCELRKVGNVSGFESSLAVG